MKKLRIISFLVWLGITFTSFLNNSKSTNEVPYPEDYRTWSHVKTAIIDSQSRAFKRFGGFHHIYANEKAMAGFNTGSFSDGAMFVFDVLEAIEKNGEITEGRRKFIDVMVKDSKMYEGTGGWGFEEFKEESKTERTVKETAKAQCFNCHSSQQKSDFVFSTYRK